jgi:trans-aconitate methyltransferase
MSGFSAQWLALREPHDLRARNAIVLDALAEAFRDQSSIAVVDLACGTGATVRAIGPRLPSRQSWRLVDNDLGLLARAGALAKPPQVHVAARPIDLARDLELALDGPLDLITCTALLDLVS